MVCGPCPKAKGRLAPPKRKRRPQACRSYPRESRNRPSGLKLLGLGLGRVGLGCGRADCGCSFPVGREEVTSAAAPPGVQQTLNLWTFGWRHKPASEPGSPPPGYRRRRRRRRRPRLHPAIACRGVQPPLLLLGPGR